MSLPSSFSRGTDSPVMGDSSTCDFPSVTTPSRGIRAPGGTRSMLPICSTSTGTIFSAPPSTSTACSGERSINSWMERRLRDTAQPSSVSPSAKSTTTSAPSTHSPMAAAPTTATVMSTFMSTFRVRSTVNRPLRAMEEPPTTMAAAMKGTAADFGQEVASMMTTPAKSRRKEAPVVSRRRSRKGESGFRDRRLLTTGASFLLLLAGVVIMLATSWPKSAAVAFMAAAIVVGGYSMARNGLFTVLRTRNVVMNVLMTVAVVGAAAIGEWVEGALVVVLFALGETLEGWAVSRSRRSIQELIDLSPEQAVLVEDGAEKIVPVEALQIGNMLRVPPGARIPLDGVVTEGKSQVDESPITGESVPRKKEEGSDLYAGTVNGPGSLRMRVTSLAGDSTLARIIEMVEEAQGRKASSQRWVDSFARWYTPAVMVLAALTVTVPPLMFGAAWGDWVYRGLALLILSCPCALVISTPVSIV